MHNKILITGAGGFVGKHLIENLLAHNDATIYGNVYSPTSDLAALLAPSQIIPADLTDYHSTRELLAQTSPDLIYHLASLSIVQDSAGPRAGQILTNNLLLQYNLLEAIRELGLHPRIISISTGNVYGNAQADELPMSETTPLRPLNPYAVSKLSQEYLSLQYHLAYHQDIVILRPFNHTGPGQTTDFIVPLLASQFAAFLRGANAVLHLGNLDTARDFTDVRDMCEAYRLAATHCQAGQIYNLGSGQGITLREIIRVLSELTAITPKLEIDPARVRTSDVPLLVCDSHKFRQATSWAPVHSLRDTLKSVLQYYIDKPAQGVI